MGADTKHLLSINGAALVVLLLSAILYTSDHGAYERALREKETATTLAAEHVAQIGASVSALDARLRAWLSRSNRAKWASLERGELYKSPWKGSEGGRELEPQRASQASKAPPITALGPGPRIPRVPSFTSTEGIEVKVAHEVTLEAAPMLELTDEALLHWEMASQDKRKRAIIHSPLAPGVVTQIPGREEAPGEDAVLTDYSNSRPLLAYTKDQFTTRKVSEMLDAYAPPASGKPASKLSCDDDFGSGLVKRWRDTKQEWCSAVGQASRDASGGGRAGGSTLTCYFIKQTEHGGDGDNLCVLENMSIDLSAFSDESVTKKVMHDYKSSSHNDEAYIHFGKGTVQAQCKMDTTNYNQNKFPGWNADWLYTGLDYSEQPHDRLACQVWEDTPTLIIQRDTFANMYHDTEDFVNAFLALAILELPLKNVQVFLTDLYPWGPFEAIWRQAFGFGNAALTAWEVKDKYGGKRVCFKQAIVGVYGPASPFCIMATDTGCQSSPLMRAYSDFVTRGMDLARYTYNVHKKPSPVVVINWMARRSSVKWPERTFCDEHYFKCNLFQHLKERSLSRVVTNDKECVQHLKKVAEDTKVDGKVLFFIDADYNLLPFEMQMRYNLMTDILIGPHGAGLTHQMFLPDRARVIELFVDGSSANRHFHNMARWRGRSGDMYQGVDIENPVPLKKVEDLVVGAVRKLAVDKY